MSTSTALSVARTDAPGAPGAASPDRRTAKPYDILVFVGRFQIFHEGHKRVVDRALELSEHVVMLFGSANAAPSIRDPFSFGERTDMVARVYPGQRDRLIFRPLNDTMYNDTAWVFRVQEIVKQVLDGFPENPPHNTLHGLRDIRIGLIGCSKDRSSYYLKLFPTWKSEEVEFLDPINATDLRALIFRDTPERIGDMHLGDRALSDGVLPGSVIDDLEAYRATGAFRHLVDEQAFIQRYRSQFEDYPYPPTFVTVDAVVIQSGHILMIRRKGRPGKGQLALPGGFVGQQETLEEAMLRELREETRLKVPTPVIKGSIRSVRTFDDPHRSQRGRTLTTAFLVQLADQAALPRIKAGSDARDAIWLPLADLDPHECFEDHFHIVQALVAQTALT